MSGRECAKHCRQMCPQDFDLLISQKPLLNAWKDRLESCDSKEEKKREGEKFTEACTSLPWVIDSYYK